MYVSRADHWKYTLKASFMSVDVKLQWFLKSQTCSFAHVFFCIHSCVYGGQRSTLDVYLNHCLLYILSYDLSLNMSYPTSPRDTLVFGSSVLGSQVCAVGSNNFVIWMLEIELVLRWQTLYLLRHLPYHKSQLYL